MAGGGVGVGIDETTGGGVVISALQIIEPGISEVEAANCAKNDLNFDVPGGVVPLRFFAFCRV